MTTNLSAIAGPSREVNAEIQPKAEPTSPIVPVGPNEVGGANGDVGVSKPGLTVGENGEVVKVPAFLNKLYSMVSDPETDDLIYWAESGDSFFVPNHERFGKELLPRFFKHSNFSSFVRQLNMYGFHKVPHLQSGVLKNESPSELWEFVNPFFKRDQPQLLSRVTRKNNRPATNAPTPSQGATGSRSGRQSGGSSTPGPFSGIHLLTDGTTQGEAGPLVSTGQLADLHAIQNGINAIRQTQAAIGADLKALQSSNEHLWREAIESRERQQKHEETIDLIVSFLERLFGTEGEGLKGLKTAMRRGGLSRNREDSVSDDGSTKKRRRLMIEGNEKEGDGGRFSEIQDPTVSVEPASSTASQRSSAEPWSSSDRRFTALPTDDEASPFPSHSSMKPGVTPGSDPTLHQGGISPLSDTHPDLHGTDANALLPYAHGQNAEDMTGMNLDPTLLNTTIGSLLQSPAAAQMFFNSLNSSVQGQALQQGSGKAPAPSPPLSTGTEADPTMALLSPLPSNLVNQQQDLLGAYNKTMGVNNDMDHLQESIDSLVRNMGLDLPNGTGTPNPTPTTGVPGAAGGPPMHDPSLAPEGTFNEADFNVEDFLNQLAKEEPKS